MNTVDFSRMMRTALSIALAVIILSSGTPTLSFAAAEKGNEELQIVKGDIQSIPAKNLKRVSITDPVVADINDARIDSVDIIAIDPGQTVLFIWDDSGKRTVIIRVVQEDPGLVKKRLQSLLAGVGIKNVVLSENKDEGKVVLTGALSEEKMEVLIKVIDPFMDRIINLVQKEKIEDLVQIDMQITELSTTLTKEMGIDWGMDGATNPLNPTFKETIPTNQGSLSDMWRIGSLSRTNALVGAINALIEEGKGKILSKPRLVVISGKEATFLVGGEIPINTTTTSASGGSTQQNKTFKPYGVTMAVTPSIQAGNLVNILLNAEISEIDGSKPTGTDVAFLTRSAKTQLLLQDHQTIVLAGMIKRRNTEVVRRVPFLSKIPVVGIFFRSSKTPAPNEETEVVISITATILPNDKKLIEDTDKLLDTNGKDKKTPASLDVPQKSGSAFAAEDKADDFARQLKAEVNRAPALTDVVGGSNPVKSMVNKTAPAPTTPVNNKIASKVEPVKSSSPIVSEEDKYAKLIQEKISTAIAYPYEAQEKNWKGIVQLALVITKDGTLKDVVVKKSSGHPVFDQDAVNTAQILAPYDAFPQTIQAETLEITVSILYSLDSFLNNISAHK